MSSRYACWFVALENLAGDIPLGPSVTPTASASLLMPSCILFRDTLSKMMSFGVAAATCGAGWVQRNAHHPSREKILDQCRGLQADREQQHKTAQTYLHAPAHACAAPKHRQGAAHEGMPCTMHLYKHSLELGYSYVAVSCQPTLE